MQNIDPFASSAYQTGGDVEIIERKTKCRLYITLPFAESKFSSDNPALPSEGRETTIHRETFSEDDIVLSLSGVNGHSCPFFLFPRLLFLLFRRLPGGDMFVLSRMHFLYKMTLLKYCTARNFYLQWGLPINLILHLKQIKTVLHLDTVHMLDKQKIVSVIVLDL